MKLFDMIVASKVLGGGGGVTPTGTINITQNGDTDVTNYATAHVAVPQPSGKITISQNGTDIDVAQYATADVNVSGGGGDDFGKLVDGSIVSAVIPSGVTKIRDYAFRNCSKLNEVTIPNSVTTIGEYAFYYTHIRSVVFPSSLTAISPNAFEGCWLTSAVLPSGLTTIGGDAFRDCSSLASVDIPSGITSISSALRGCSSLMSITCRAENPPSLSWNGFQSVPSDCAIYVPAASVDAYKAASSWSDRAAYIQAIPSA